MKIILTVLGVIIGFEMAAQTLVKGKVLDEKGEAIPGANISIDGTYDGASSDINGEFNFETSEEGEQIISVTFVGYKTFTQTVNLAGGQVQLTATLREEINQLDAVVISAGSFTAGEEKRRTILKAVDIASTAGATADIAGALNTLPGTQKVGESGRLFVRGGDGSETRTFIDGMMVLNAYNPAAPNTPSRGRFLPFMFKGTSFSTGGYSAEYGQALSSALVLNSKDKSELNQTDFGILSVGGDVAHTQVWDHASLAGKIQYTDIRPYFGLINQRMDWIKPPVSIEGSSAFRQETGENGIIKFYGNFNHTNYSLYQYDIAEPSQKFSFDLTNNYGYGNVAFLQALNEKWFARGGVSYNYNQNELLIDGSPVDEIEKGLHAKTVLENTVSDRVELKFGLEHILVDYEASRVDNVLGRQVRQYQDPITSGFVEAELYASKKLVARTGVRGEYSQRLDNAFVDPRISIAYKPFQQGQFSFAYGRFRQTPQSIYVRTNSNLKPETAEHFILNYQLISDKRTFRTELYYKKYSDLIKFVNGNPNDLTNSGEGYAKGFEFFWRDNATFKNLDYWISYSYLDTERDYLNYPVASIPSFASTHNFSAVGKKYVSAIKSQLGVTYSFSSPRTYHNPNKEGFNNSRTPTYQDLSMNISYLPKPFLIIHASVTNVLGRDNVFGYEYSNTPDVNGVYAERAIKLPATRFIFLGVFITLSKNKSINQLPNL